MGGGLRRPTDGGNGVEPTRVPGMAAQQPARRHPASTQSAVLTYGLNSISGARGVETTGLPVRRGRQQLPEPEHAQDQPRRDPTQHPADTSGTAREPPGRSAVHHRSSPAGASRPGSSSSREASARKARGKATSRSPASTCDEAAAAAGFARTTTRIPGGIPSIRAARSARSRLFTRVRTTADPTARDTTNPNLAGGIAAEVFTGTDAADEPGAATTSTLAACTTRVRRPDLRPRLTAASKSRPRRIRCGAGSMCDRRERPGQAESSARPLRRRAERMARPARVRIRSRKPWVLARRRLFGWKVRLLTRKLHAHVAKGDMRTAPHTRGCRIRLAGTAPSPQPLRAGDNGRCQASTRYGRADRGVKPGRRASRNAARCIPMIAAHFTPTECTWGTGASLKMHMHLHRKQRSAVSVSRSVASDFASRPSGQQAMVLCAALGESATRRRGSDHARRCRSAHRDRGDLTTVDTRRTATEGRRVILRAQVVDNRVDAVLAVAHLTKEV
jgi:hypothetical protein